MLKLSIILLVAAAAILYGLSAAGDQGQVMATWYGWRIDTTAMFALISLLVTLGVALPLMKLIGWLMDAPDRILRFSKRTRERKAQENLALGLIAAEAGETRRAFELVEKASKVLEEPILKPLLELRAAQAVGDNAGAERAYAAMLADKETELLGRKGLTFAALSRGESGTAVSHAEAALKVSKEASWPFKTLYDLSLQAGLWEKALDALEEGKKRKLIDETVARRTKAVLLAAQADSEERAGRIDKASDLAEKAHRLSPTFAPAAALAARLLDTEGKQRKAEKLIEDAWEARPHPALGRAYRDLVEDEPREERAQRLEKLASMRPEHRESRLLIAEAALERRDFATAIAALGDAQREAATSRIYQFAASIAELRGDAGEVQRMTAEAARAPREADWSDLDPDGPAFLYTVEDWAKLAKAWGEEERLIHPRLEGGGAERSAAPAALSRAVAPYSGQTSASVVPTSQDVVVAQPSGVKWNFPAGQSPPHAAE
jgi:HemY protein